MSTGPQRGYPASADTIDISQSHEILPSSNQVMPTDIKTPDWAGYRLPRDGRIDNRL